jgi:hypothetical protein
MKIVTILASVMLSASLAFATNTAAPTSKEVKSAIEGSQPQSAKVATGKMEKKRHMKKAKSAPKSKVESENSSEESNK